MIRPPKKMRPGDPFTEGVVRDLVHAMRKRLIGGRGALITEVGGKVVISPRRRQTINRAVRTGSVWKFTKGLGLAWVLDPSEEVSSVTQNFSLCVDLSVSDDYMVVAVDSPGSGTFVTNIYKSLFIDPADGAFGTLRTFAGTGGIKRMALGQNNEYAETQLQFTRFIDVLNALQWTYTLSLNSQRGCVYDGSDNFYVMNTFSGATFERLVKINKLTGTPTNFSLSGFYGADGLLLDGSHLYVAGAALSPDRTCTKMSLSGVNAWTYNAGAAMTPSANVTRTGLQQGCTDVTVESGNSYWTGFRNGVWSGSSGASDYASVWKLDSAGALQWVFDSGGDLFGCCNDGDYLYVCGERNKNWGAGNRYATIWKLDFDGNVIKAYDTGRNNFYDNETGFAYVIRANSTHLYVGTYAVKQA